MKWAKYSSAQYITWYSVGLNYRVESDSDITSVVYVDCKVAMVSKSCKKIWIARMPVYPTGGQFCMKKMV